MRVAIVGGGISGLVAAYDLQKARGFEVTIFEQSRVLGGKLQTLHEGDFLIERGPDSIFSFKPWAVELMCELGMADELVEPLGNEFSILTKGKLHTVPRPLASLNPSSPGVLDAADFLSLEAKERVLKEPEIPAGNGQDESVASFFRRRFGPAFSELVAEPLLAGTHAGDPEKLSMAALYPAYLAMEQQYGSVSKGAAARAGATPHRGAFLTLASGMASFPKRLAEALTDVSLRPSTSVRTLTVSDTAVSLLTNCEDGQSSGQSENTARGHPEAPRRIAITAGQAGVTPDRDRHPTESRFDHVILATPAYVSATILRDAAPDAAALLSAIRFVSTAIVTLAYPRGAFAEPLCGNGFLVPFHEPSVLTGCTWSSNKWANRAPDDAILIRAFMGRDSGLDINGQPDDQLAVMATECLGDLLEPTRPPTMTRVDRWPKGLAQYEMGHLARLASIEGALEGLPITLIGSSYRGNGIPDCVRQAREAAARLRSGRDGVMEYWSGGEPE